VILQLSDGRNLTVPQTLSASGIRYANTDESFIFWSKGITAFTEENGQQTYTDCVDASSLSQDVYPLYEGVQWGNLNAETTTIGNTTLFGVSMASLPVKDTMDPSSVFVPFEDHYAKSLAALGWMVDPELAAGGHAGDQTGYRKGSEIILTRSAITYHTTPDNAPSECPCDVSVSVFSAQDPSKQE
jgi:hypothetical protein